MTTYYIYEVPGEKNGATKDWEARYTYNFNKYLIEPVVIETMEGPDTEEMWQIVGDREWELADLNGYDRGDHYLVIRIKAAKHDWNDVARAIARSKTVHNLEFQKAAGNARYKKSLLDGSRKKYQSLGGKALAKKERTCQYCGKTGKGVVMGRWHFDNCKHKA